MPPVSRFKEIAALHVAGHTAGDIAMQLGMSADYIARTIREHASITSANNYTPDADDHYLHLSAIGAANDGYGFPVVTAPQIDRINAKEWAPVNRREFWRAA